MDGSHTNGEVGVQFVSKQLGKMEFDQVHEYYSKSLFVFLAAVSPSNQGLIKVCLTYKAIVLQNKR